MGALLERDDKNATAESICDAAIAAAEGSFADVRKHLEQSGEEEEDLGEM